MTVQRTVIKTCISADADELKQIIDEVLVSEQLYHSHIARKIVELAKQKFTTISTVSRVETVETIETLIEGPYR